MAAGSGGVIEVSSDECQKIVLLRNCFNILNIMSLNEEEFVEIYQTAERLINE